MRPNLDPLELLGDGLTAAFLDGPAQTVSAPDPGQDAGNDLMALIPIIVIFLAVYYGR